MRIVLGLVRRDSGTVHLLGQDLDRAGGAIPDGVAGFVDAPRFTPTYRVARTSTLLSRLDGRGGRFEPGAVSDALAQAALAAMPTGRSRDTRRVCASVSALPLRCSARRGCCSSMSRRLRSIRRATREVRTLLERLAAEGTSVVLSSHDMNEVEEICDAVTILHVGKVVFSGTMDELRGRAPASIHALRTSNDAGALLLASGARRRAGRPLRSKATAWTCLRTAPALDAYVIALGHAGIAVRRLEQRASSLESLFLQLTADGAPPGPPGPAVDGAAAARSREASVTLRGVRAVVGVECAKVGAQLKARAVLALCVAGPFAFVAAMRVQSEMPEDTLFGRALKESGFATPLVILGFAALWVFPVLTAVIGGDLFSAEDRYGTWATALTRSRTRAEVFAGKVVTALGFSTDRDPRAGRQQCARRHARRRSAAARRSLGCAARAAACARQRCTRLDLGAAAGVWVYRARRA